MTQSLAITIEPAMHTSNYVMVYTGKYPYGNRSLRKEVTNKAERILATDWIYGPTLSRGGSCVAGNVT